MNIDREYEAAPLVEALCELHFQSAQWDWTIPGLMYNQISNAFPKKRQQEWLGFQVPKDTRQRQEIKHGIEKMQFLSDDERQIIQLGTNLITINVLSPYPGWATFRTIILENVKKYWDIAKPEKIANVALRYINHIDFDPPIQDEEYFKIAPQLPPPIPANRTGCLLRSDVLYEESPRMILRVLFGTRQAEKNKIGFVFDLNVATEIESPQIEDLESWLQQAHTRLKTAFVVSLTEKAHREVFKEVMS